MKRVRRSQSGVALVVVLMFVLALSVLAAFSARNSSVGERVARNQLDYQTARQAAEAALRDAERDLLLTTGAIRPSAVCARGAARPVMDGPGLASFSSNCLGGQCSLPPATYTTANYATAVAGSVAEPWWPVARGGLWNNNFSIKPSRSTSAANCGTFVGAVPLGTYTGAPPISGVSRQPEYLIEVLERGRIYFRISARGFGYNPATQVVLQSYFKPFY
jgi:type IV pilus assembly protein PilX